MIVFDGGWWLLKLISYPGICGIAVNVQSCSVKKSRFYNLWIWIYIIKHYTTAKICLWQQRTFLRNTENIFLSNILIKLIIKLFYEDHLFLSIYTCFFYIFIYFYIHVFFSIKRFIFSILLIKYYTNDFGFKVFYLFFFPQLRK